MTMKLKETLLVLTVTLVMAACVRYPTVPKIEEMDTPQAKPAPQEISQTKAPAPPPEREIKQKESPLRTRKEILPRELAPARNLVDVSVDTSQNGTVVLTLKADGRWGDYSTIDLNNPARLVMDLWKIKRKFLRKEIFVNSPYLEKVRLGDHSKKVRVVLDFSAKFPPYTLGCFDDELRIVLGKKIEASVPVIKQEVGKEQIHRPVSVTTEATSAKVHGDKNYVIGPEDLLKIQVWDHPDLEREVHVSREGEFSYPLIGKVHAKGLTVLELERDITRRLRKGYIVNPQVTVTVKEYHSKKVFVLGEVVNRGTYSLTGQTTLLEILAKAGGPAPEAGKEVIVARPRNHVRKDNPTPLEEAREGEVIGLNLQKLMDGDISQNIYLQHGDTIYVSNAQYYYVFGQVNNPGKYVLQKGTTVLKAITIAGGVTKVAAVNRTKVLREKEGVRVKIKVKMTDPIMPEDIIMVPESFF